MSDTLHFKMFRWRTILLEVLEHHTNNAGGGPRDDYITQAGRDQVSTVFMEIDIAFEAAGGRKKMIKEWKEEDENSKSDASDED